MTATATKPTKPARTLRWTPSFGRPEPAAGVLEITQGRETTTYAVCEFPTDRGDRGFVLQKVGASIECYGVFCSPRGPAFDACECKAFQFRRTCRHKDAVRKLMDLGKL